jgi:hypothetical protein
MQRNPIPGSPQYSGKLFGFPFGYDIIVFTMIDHPLHWGAANDPVSLRPARARYTDGTNSILPSRQCKSEEAAIRISKKARRAIARLRQIFFVAKDNIERPNDLRKMGFQELWIGIAPDAKKVKIMR